MVSLTIVALQRYFVGEALGSVILFDMFQSWAGCLTICLFLALFLWQ